MSRAYQPTREPVGPPPFATGAPWWWERFAGVHAYIVATALSSWHLAAVPVTAPYIVSSADADMAATALRTSPSFRGIGLPGPWREPLGVSHAAALCNTQQPPRWSALRRPSVVYLLEYHRPDHASTEQALCRACYAILWESVLAVRERLGWAGAGWAPPGILDSTDRRLPHVITSRPCRARGRRSQPHALTEAVLSCGALEIPLAGDAAVDAVNGACARDHT